MHILFLLPLPAADFLQTGKGQQVFCNVFYFFCVESSSLEQKATHTENREVYVIDKSE